MMSSVSNKNFEIRIGWKKMSSMFIHTKLGSNPGSMFDYLLVG